MSYLDSEFNEHLERDILGTSQEQSAIDLDSMTDSLNVSKITANGPLNSSDGRSSFNFETNTYTISDGLVERIRLGVMEDGSIGFRIQDQDGNILMNITGITNLIQSANGKMQLDLTEEQARWYDETHLRILVGKSQGKF